MTKKIYYFNFHFITKFIFSAANKNILNVSTFSRQLETQIEQFKSASIPEKGGDATPKEADGTNGFLKYEMMYLPEKARMHQVARVSNLAQRLAKLEGIIGANDDKLSKFTQVLLHYQ